MMGKGREAATLLVLYAWSLGWILSRQFADIPPGNDSAYYLTSAQGFAAGLPFRDLSSPDPQAGALLGPTFFPLLLSLYWLFLSPNLPALKCMVALIMAIAPVAAYLWMRLHIPARLAFLSALAFGASYIFVVQGNSIMTECVFCPLLYLGLWMSQRNESAPGLREIPAPGRARSWAALIPWVLIARTRVSGWFFLGVFAFLSGRRGKWPLAAAAVLAAAAWVVLEKSLSRGVRVIRYTDGLFTDIYPILVDPWLGTVALARNLWDNLWGFASANAAHILFPYIYSLSAMSATKRLACLAVFLWTAWGLVIAVRRRKSLNPWLLAAFLASVPTFVIFRPHDSFRYLMPFFPFLMVFFLEPWIHLSERARAGWRRSLPMVAGLVVVVGQAMHSLGHDFESEFLSYSSDFAALHAFLLAEKSRPDICLSPDAYYTYLKTGCPTFNLQERHPLGYVMPIAKGKETWAICGWRNDYYCEEWERKGVVFAMPPLMTSGPWRLMRVERWPAEGK